MSEATATAAARRARNANGEHNAQHAAPGTHETAHTPAAAPVPTGSRAVKFVEMDNLEVDLAVRWCAGMVMADREAEAVMAFCTRQFANNMNANAKARAKRRADAIAAGKTPDAGDAPYTAEEVQTIWSTYFPNVGGVDREATEAKMRQSAAWKAWVKIVGAHNGDVEAGGQGIIAKAPGKLVGLVGTKDGARDAFVSALLSSGKYATEIEAEYSQLVAERGTAKPAGDKVVLGAEDLL